jgi:hypothetical protein
MVKGGHPVVAFNQNEESVLTTWHYMDGPTLFVEAILDYPGSVRKEEKNVSVCVCVCVCESE